MTLVQDPTTSSPFTLRHATHADLEAILALECATENAPHWPLSTYAAILNPQEAGTPRRCLLIAEQHNLIVGFAAALTHADKTPAELETVAVSTTARRTGVGRALCAATLNWCSEQGATSILLEVRAGNTAAIALYNSLGFLTQGRRPNYYSDPDEDALILHRLLERYS